MFDPETLDKAALVETNRRLNKRCQKWEKLARKYRRRYVTIQNPVAEALKRLRGTLHQVQEVRDATAKDSYIHVCPWCRAKWNFKRWIRGW